MLAEGASGRWHKPIASPANASLSGPAPAPPGGPSDRILGFLGERLAAYKPRRVLADEERAATEIVQPRPGLDAGVRR